jgi:hypothetical protein
MQFESKLAYSSIEYKGLTDTSVQRNVKTNLGITQKNTFQEKKKRKREA